MTRSIFSMVAAGVFLAGANAFALGKTDCSNADGSVKRVEEEIWGANPVSYVVNGQENRQEDVIVRYDSKRVLGATSTRVGSSETYAARLSLARRDGGMLGPGAGGTETGVKEIAQWVICYSWKNSARD